MPRLVDHDERRRQITDAARRVIVRGGLAAATFQAVAAEAGISVRLVQYYFGTKKDFLLGTLKAVLDDMAVRFIRQVEALGPDPDPRAAMRATALALLPLDETRRAEALVLSAYQTARLTGSPTIPGETLEAPRLLAQTFAGHLRRARGSDTDAELLTGILVGLTQSTLAGYHTPDRATALVDHALDRLLGSAPRR
ncbi:TetR/AcrR family transcriptional regulator [Nocardia farcinica]|uniref:TetR/AcrR family transcriptional regulator n=1 Tax=Nocardia farcinica TaxID=37329 RepID=UPI0015F0ED47|nr:TetR/AcrR family transcriptional regulator [Nocardia farcinica]MBA4854545.1 TetR/AcrR family transcriptional regulator [Nocardia farcinica]MBC9814730.1 TetR/AcrR family transcriptional regulator [Nocardia farcinica]